MHAVVDHTRIQDMPDIYERLGSAFEAGLQNCRNEFLAVLRAEFAMPMEHASSSLYVAEETSFAERVTEDTVQRRCMKSHAASYPLAARIAEIRQTPTPRLISARSSPRTPVSRPCLPSVPGSDIELDDVRSQLDALLCSVQQVCKHLGVGAVEDSSPVLVMTIDDAPSPGPAPVVDSFGLDAESTSCSLVKNSLLPLWVDDAKAGERVSGSAVEDSTRIDSLQWISVLNNVREVASMETISSTATQDLEAASPWFLTWMERFIIHPSSSSVIFWDAVGGLLISYDVTMIPMENFPLPANLFFDVMTMVVLLYWTADVFLRFFIGFFNQGLLEMTPALIMWNYLSTWFMIDVFVVAMDWVFLALGASGQATRSWRIGRAARVFRLLRLIRLIRIVKFLKLMNLLVDCIRSEWRVLTTRAIYTSLSVIASAHYLACYWYAVGVWDSAASTSWVKEHSLESGSPSSLYVASMHWSLAQSGLASTLIAPTNPLEQSYSVLCSLCWLVMMPFVVACVTTWLMQIREVNADFWAQEAQIRIFLAHHKVSVRLTNLIFRFFRVHFESRAHTLQESDVQIFGNFPPLLYIKLHEEMYMPVLKIHPALSLFARTSTKSALSVCHLAMSESYLTTGTNVFTEGQEAQSMVIVASGEFDYYMGAASRSPALRTSGVASQKPSTTCIRSGEWACEVCLWRHWVHPGTLEAARTSEMVAVSAERFHATLCECVDNGWTNDALKTYAANIVDNLSSASDLCEDVRLIAQIAHEAWEADIQLHRLESWKSMRTVETRTRSTTSLTLRKSASDTLMILKQQQPDSSLTTGQLREEVQAIR